MTPYSNTNPCPRCGGTDYMYIVGDGPVNPEHPTHYGHTGTRSECKNCGYQVTFWNHEIGFIPPKPYVHSIIMSQYHYQHHPECKLLLTDIHYLVFNPEDTYIAVQTWLTFQKERHSGLTQALDNVVKNLDLKPAQG